MERKELETATRVTDRAVVEGKAIVFNYEKHSAKNTTACEFVVFPDEKSAEPQMNGSVKLEENHATVYFNTPPAPGQLSLLATIIAEIENIFGLQKTTPADEASASE